jgi:outer membrane protein insertion porin family
MTIINSKAIRPFALVCFFLLSLIATPVYSQVMIGSGIDYANPKPYRIAGISVVGATFSDVQAIKLFSGLQEGQEIILPGDKISDAIRKLWKQRLFTNISIAVAEYRGEDVYLVITVEEAPRLAKYEFEGIKKSDGDNVREKIDLRAGTVVTQNALNNAIATIKEYYTEKGFYNASVKVNQTPDVLNQNMVILSFNIDRGPRIKIEEIRLHGVGVMTEEKRTLPFGVKKTKPIISERKVKRAMKGTKQKRWYGIFKSSKYIEDDYFEDKQNIIAKYNKAGFRNAKILNDSIYLVTVDDKKRMIIDLYIEEDRRFYFRNITFVGNTKYSSSAIDSVLNIRKGAIYNSELLNARLNFNPQGRDVSSMYTDDGYLGFRVEPVETFVDPDSIDIEVRMYEGSQFRIGKITVVGNTKTNDHVIFREIRTRPGELFNRSDIIRTQRELAALGYFNPEAFDVRTMPNEANGTVDLEYVLEEKPNDQIQLSGGWGGNRVVGSLALSFTNFSMRNFFKKGAWSPLPTGDGQRFSIQAQSNGVFFQSYNMSFTEPWLGGKKPNSLSFSAFRSVQSNGVSKKQEEGDPLLKRRSLSISGGSINFGQRLKRPDDFFQMLVGVTYQYFDLDSLGSFFSFQKGYSNNLAADFRLDRNSLSDLIYPTWGSKITFNAKLTLPYTKIGETFFNRTYDYDAMSDQERFKWVEYHKWKLTANWVTALNKHKERKFVLSTNAGFGLLSSWNKQLGQPPFERFYLGGVFLSGFLLDGREIVNLRGYDDLSLTASNKTGVQGENVGALGIAKYGAELRYPLSTNPSATIYALTFLEAANTFNSASNFNPFDLYRSGGVGVRIFLPMFGLLGFDYGWRFDDVPRRTMTKGQFHFSIGMNLGEL